MVFWNLYDVGKPPVYRRMFHSGLSSAIGLWLIVDSSLSAFVRNQTKILLKMDTEDG